MTAVDAPQPEPHWYACLRCEARCYWQRIQTGGSWVHEHPADHEAVVGGDIPGVGRSRATRTDRMSGPESVLPAPVGIRAGCFGGEHLTDERAFIGWAFQVRDHAVRLQNELEQLRGVVQAIYDHCGGHGTDRFEAQLSDEIRFIIEDQDALAAAAERSPDASQPETCGVEWVGCYAADLHYSCAEPKGHVGNHRAGPSPAVLPETPEQQR